MSGKDRPLRELVALYLVDLATRATAAHVKNTRGRLDHVFRHGKARTVAEIQPVPLIGYRAQRLAEGVALRTANVHVDPLRSMFEWAVKLDLIARNPLAHRRRRRRSGQDADDP